MKTNRIKALVIVEGGCVSDVLSLHPVEYDIWDWDDFSDSPLDYWGGRTPEQQAGIKALVSPSVYRDIMIAVAQEQHEMDKQEQEERDRDPFHEVPAC